MLLSTTATVEASVWGFVQEVVQFALALASLAVLAYPIVKRQRTKRAEERAAHEERRRKEIAEQVEAALAPVRKQIEAIHHTTTVNGGKNSPPTLRDEVSSAVKVAGLIAVNLAELSERFDQHEDAGRLYLERVRQIFAEHGIELPER